MTHGSNTTYIKKGCRCPECTTAHAEVQARFYNNRLETRIEALGLKDRPCDWCGDATSPKEYDHVNPQRKTATYAALLRWGTDKAIKAEVENCGINVLCGQDSVNRCHQRKKSLFILDGVTHVLIDAGYGKRSHPVRVHGQFIGWTCEEVDSTGRILGMIDLLAQSNARLAEIAA